MDRLMLTTGKFLPTDGSPMKDPEWYMRLPDIHISNSYPTWHIFHNKCSKPIHVHFIYWSLEWSSSCFGVSQRLIWITNTIFRSGTLSGRCIKETTRYVVSLMQIVLVVLFLKDRLQVIVYLSVVTKCLGKARNNTPSKGYCVFVSVT